jgi:hypothetical protein
MFLIVCFSFAEVKTFCYGAEGTIASIHIIRKATDCTCLSKPLYSTLGDGYCREKLVKGEVSILVKNPLLNHQTDKKITITENI